MDPIEMIGVCDVCGKADDLCICPECPVCGVVGRERCYGSPHIGGHGLQMSYDQIISYQQFTEAMDEAAEENARYMEKLSELHGENNP